MSFSSFAYKCQRFRERRQSCLSFSHRPMCLGEERQPIRSPSLCACSPKGDHALRDLLNPLTGLSLLRQCPASQTHTHRLPLQKSLLRGKPDGGFSAFLGYPPLAAELMEYRRTPHGETQAKGVCQLLR